MVLLNRMLQAIGNFETANFGSTFQTKLFPEGKLHNGNVSGKMTIIIIIVTLSVDEKCSYVRNISQYLLLLLVLNIIS